MELKISSGHFKGRKIFLKDSNKDLRPTPAIHRQALFNRLGNDLTGLKMLDLFCGSGIIGLEALSRNAEKVCFVDNDRKNIKALQNSIIKLAIPSEKYVINNSDYDVFMKNESNQYDIIYLDPPFRLINSSIDIYLKILNTLKESLLSEKGLVIIESPKKSINKESLSEWSNIFYQSFGSVAISGWKAD